MNTHFTKPVQLLLIAAFAVLTVNAVWADDLNPAPYRGDPLSVYAHWIPDPAGGPALVLDTWNAVDDVDPLTILHSLLPTDKIDPTPDHEYKFDLPNWIDNLPVKYMRVQLTWMYDPAPPTFIDISGIEGSSGVPGNIVGTSGVVVVDPSVGKYYQYYDIEFYPNPDAERWAVSLPDNALLVQAVADTVSTVPEPSTMILLAVGSFAMLRKNK